MKTMTTKLVELVNKFAAAMECPSMRQIPLWMADREIELVSLIILAKFALAASVMQGFKPAIIAAIIITAISYVWRCIGTVQAILEAIDDYHEWRSRRDAYKAWKREIDRFNAWNEKLHEAVEAAKASEKNQE